MRIVGLVIELLKKNHNQKININKNKIKNKKTEKLFIVSVFLFDHSSIYLINFGKLYLFNKYNS